MAVLPDEIVNRFRVVSLERLEQIESAWSQVIEEPDNGDAAARVHRLVHTLKGDSRLVGFTDVNLVCHKLEDLIALARERHYKVGDDFDLAVTMAIRFMAILIRKRVGTELGGIDLPGFVQQIDGVLAETRRQIVDAVEEPAMRRTGSRKDEIALLRRRMVQPVIDIFIEALASDRPRLRRAWTALRPLVAPAAAEPVAPCLRKHDAGARALAVELGKQVDLRFEVDDVDAAPDIIAVIDLAVLHLLRNALDHGVESPGARVAAGKNATARVVVRLTRVGGAFELTVSDDGRGIDLGGVRARAVVQGLIRADARPSPAELGALLFRPGFSTRTVPTDVSGRGVGLDAVGAAIDAAGGTITVESQPGRGATWTATVPAPPTRVAANAFRAPGRSTPLAVGTDWSVAVRAADGAIDPLVALGIPHRPVPGGDAIGLEFTRGARSIVLLAAAPPVVASAESVVATAGAPASIALIDGIEGLLLDPEALA